jgi:flagellar biosynthesis/type III secretory pathway protein FliH
MTDEEILEKYREKIDKNINILLDKYNIEDGVEQQNFSNGYREGFVEGFRKGYAEGLQKNIEEKKNIARKILAKGMGLKDVCEMTGLSAEIIGSLREGEESK